MLGYTRFRRAVKAAVIGSVFLGLSGLIGGCAVSEEPSMFRKHKTLDAVVVAEEDGGVISYDSGVDGGFSYDGSKPDQGFYSDINEGTDNGSDSIDGGLPSTDSGEVDLGGSDAGLGRPVARLNCPENLGPNQDQQETICMANANEDVRFSACDSFAPDGSIVRYQLHDANVIQGNVDIMGIVRDDGWTDLNDCNFTRAFNGGESALCLRVLDDRGFYSEPDCNRVVVNAPQELRAVACPDVAEFAGGPYRINDANDAHNGWCKYDVAVHDAFRFDGCRSTGTIDRYLFDYGLTRNDSYDQCFSEGFIAFSNPGTYEGRLVVFPDRNNTNLKSEDWVLFNAN